MRQAVETYFREMNDIRGTGSGTSETSYYAPLIALLNTLGEGLRPTVFAVSTPRNTGSGIPDIGLFTREQRIALEEGQPIVSVPPGRGVLEAKPLRDDVVAIAGSNQVTRYVERYEQVLVTNFRDFQLVDHDANGEIRLSERLTIARDEAEFWQLAQRPHQYAETIGDQLAEFLHRLMVRQVSLTQPGDVALLLASYARDMRARLEQQDLDELAPLRDALETSLGISFKGDDGAHFFRSTVVQTLFYGMFSAWVLQKRDIGRRNSVDAFDWRASGYNLRVPAIQTLFHEFSRPSAITKLDLADVLDWTGEMLNRIDTGQFFARFAEDHAVQYFYEPFLEAFDPELRKQLGVWYTPHEIVTYMVERVDRVLREELGVARGLADDNVYVLDPCTGTGSYLVGVLRRIHATLKAEGADALTANDLKEAVKTRLFGFELLPAPFVVAHLQLGLALQELGAPLQSGTNERPAIFLTNALTGWDLSQANTTAQLRTHNLLADLERERNAAGEVKRDKPILVVIGNPPYNGYAGIGIDEERDLSDAYRASKGTRQPQGQGLNDLYVRFFRMAERRIVEQTGKGVVCYISNYSWLDGLSFPAMRERYLDVFEQIWIDNLHGDRIISEYAPDGRTSETVFAIDQRSPGIRIGTAISTLVVREDSQSGTADVLYRDMDQARATERTKALLNSLDSDNFASQYQQLNPVAELGLPFKPRAVTVRYLTWPLLTDLFPVSFPGVKTSRDDVVVDVDRDRLVERMQTYFDPDRTDAEIQRLIPGAMDSTARFNANTVRAQLVRRGFLPQHIIRYAYRPFDVRWLYWEPETKLLDEKRTEYVPHVVPGNSALISQRRPRREWSVPQNISAIGCLDLMDRGASCFPLEIVEESFRRWPNVSDTASKYLQLGNDDFRELAFHVFATMHAPVYRAEHAGALRQDWPHIPLPTDPEGLAHSAGLGHQLAALLDIEQDVPGISSGTLRFGLRDVAVLSKTCGGAINPDTDDMLVNMRWGRLDGSKVMPGRGRAIERAVSPDESAVLGETTFDIHLNDLVYWRNVPERVWDYTLGGYQVLKKWLSYRESAVLSRNLKADEARTFSQIARRIAAILLMEDELDASYRRCSAETWDWQAAVAAMKPQRAMFGDIGARDG